MLNSLLCQRTHMQKKCKKMWKCYLILNYKANSYITTPYVTENCQVLESPVVFLPSHSFHSSLLSHFTIINSWLFFTNVLQVCIPKQYHKVLFAFEVDIYIYPILHVSLQLLVFVYSYCSWILIIVYQQLFIHFTFFFF